MSSHGLVRRVHALQRLPACTRVIAHEQLDLLRSALQPPSCTPFAGTRKDGTHHHHHPQQLTQSFTECAWPGVPKPSKACVNSGLDLAHLHVLPGEIETP
eukprot:1157955-Pelagomonas_calceolata.AAC.4